MRALLADDQDRVRSALWLLLSQTSAAQVVGEATKLTQVLTRLGDVQPDVVLLDWELPGWPANGSVDALRRFSPDLKVIVLSGRPEARQAALDAGADAFVSKNDPPEKLLARLEEMCSPRDSNQRDRA